MSESSLPRHRLHYLLWLLYLASGFAGLVYEVIWIRLFGLKFGVSSLAVGSVLAAFMLGLALGSHFWGRFVDKHRFPLKLYAALELGVGLYALAFPYLLEIADKFYLDLYQGYQPNFNLLSLGRFFIALGLILLPTFLMGGTLPVLAKFLGQKIELIGREVGYLYGINLLGAMLGCLTASFLLLGLLGVQYTNYLAVGLNLMIALTAFFLSQRFEPKNVQPTVGVIQQTDVSQKLCLPQYWRYLILLVAIGAGFTSLSYEVLWNRILALMLRNTVYAFSTMLTTFLGGLFLGSLLISKVLDRKQSILPQLLGLLELGIGLYALAVIPLFGKLNELFFYFEVEKGIFGHSWGLFATGQFLLCALVMLLPAMLMGAVFPLACKLYFLVPAKAGAQEIATGQGVGRVYALNTLGAVFGAFFSSFWLIPKLSTQGSVMLTAGINLILGIGIIFLASRLIPLGKGWLWLILLFCFAGWGMQQDIAFRQVIETAGEEILYHQEDNTSLIEVTRQKDTGIRMLISNRQQQEGDSGWVSVYNQRKQVYLPLFLHPEPQQVLGIGLGTGISFAALENYPLKLAECVELSSGVIQAASFFSNENNDILHNANIKIIEADGRNYLRLTKHKYDLIIADLFSAYRAGVGNLYTREHYLQCKAKLKPAGIMCQWLPPHQLPGQSLKVIVSTFMSVFPHSSLWLTHHAMALIATPNRLKIDYKRFKAYFDHQQLRKDLTAVGLNNPFDFLSSFLMGEDRLAEYIKGMPVNTDDNPLIEFTTPKEFYLLRDISWLFKQHVAEVLPYRESIYPYLINFEEQLKHQLQGNSTAYEHFQQGEMLAATGDYMAAVKEFRQALLLNPNQIDARRAMEKHYLAQAQELSNSGLSNQAIIMYKKALEMVPQSAQVNFELGKIYYQQGNYSQSKQAFSALLKIDPYNQQAQSYLEQIPQLQ